MPNVTVIIPTFNCAEYLSNSVDSILSQTYQDFEIIIIDDGSTDNTKEIVENYISKSPDKLKYYYQENRGQAIARNVGLRYSQGKYIALLDADDIWMPTRLEEGVKILDDYPDIGLVHSNIIVITEKGAPVLAIKRNKKYLSGNIAEHLLTQKAHVSSPTVLFRKDCSLLIGGFDEKLSRLGSEDRDLWIRIAQKYKVRYIDKPLAYYRMRLNRTSTNQRIMFEGIRYVINKYCQGKNMHGLRKRSFAKVYRDLGDRFLFDRNFKESKVCYLKALNFSPFSFWPAVNFLKAALKIDIQRQK